MSEEGYWDENNRFIYGHYDENQQWVNLGYYDEQGNWIDLTVSDESHAGTYNAAAEGAPKDNLHDAEGRLLDRRKVIDISEGPEDPSLFVREWRRPFMASEYDGMRASMTVWPDIDWMVKLVRLDIFESEQPRAQQATTDMEESRRIRRQPGWKHVRTLFFLNKPIQTSKTICIETAAPPRRHKFRPEGKSNSRDLTTWISKECIYAFNSSERVPGSENYFIEFIDTPDRYFISSGYEIGHGMRRLWQFAGYPVTQYYILERRVIHDCLEAEGGSGMTFTIEHGLSVYAKKHWRITGSFYAFNHQLLGSLLYTVYVRDDPFPRMQICLGPLDKPEEWTVKAQFYAFDIPVPGTCVFEVHYCVRSIYSVAASVPRHRLTTQEKRNPWEFRMSLYVFPAELEDVNIEV